jgi:hypothetical protein
MHLAALVRAYQMLDSFSQDDTSTVRKVKDIHVQLQKLEPGEPSRAREYVLLVADTGERIRLLREAVQRSPFPDGSSSVPNCGLEVPSALSC